MNEVVEFHKKLGAEFSDSGTILKYAAGIEAEYNAVRRGIGIFDYLDLRIFSVKGDMATGWLNTILTGNIEFLEYNHILFTALLDEGGGLIDLLQVFRTLDGFLIFATPSQGDKILALLNEKNTEGVEITDESEVYAVVSIEGCYSWELAKEVAGMDVVGLNYSSFLTTSFENIPELHCARCGITGEYGFRFIFAREYISFFLEFFNSYETEREKAFCGREVLNTLTQEVRYPVFGIGINEGDNLIEKGLNWMIDFRKESYLGQESVQAAISDPGSGKMVGFLCETKVDDPIDGCKVFIEDEKVGYVVMSAYSFTLKRTVGYIQFERSWACPGITEYKIQVGDKRVPLKTASTAFFLTESIKVQMI